MTFKRYIASVIVGLARDVGMRECYHQRGEDVIIWK